MGLISEVTFDPVYVAVYAKIKPALTELPCATPARASPELRRYLEGTSPDSGSRGQHLRSAQGPDVLGEPGNPIYLSAGCVRRKPARDQRRAWSRGAGDPDRGGNLRLPVSCCLPTVNTAWSRKARGPYPVDLLSQQAEIVHVADGTLEHLPRLPRPVGKSQRLRQPERAQDEAALAAVPAVASGPGG